MTVLPWFQAIVRSTQTGELVIQYRRINLKEKTNPLKLKVFLLKIKILERNCLCVKCIIFYCAVDWTWILCCRIVERRAG